MTDQDLTLTQKQERFCIEYLATGNSREAYRRAYDVAPDTLPSTLSKSAHELMQMPEVKARIVELRAEAAEQAVIDQAQVLVELLRSLSGNVVGAVRSWPEEDGEASD